MATTKSYKDIQQEVILRYGIKINTNSKCWSRTHAHVKERMVCKWDSKNSIASTFTLFHEIGHIQTTTSKMRRAEQEYYATTWAIDKCKEYGLNVPVAIIDKYQRYIVNEIARGLRRGGKGYDRLNLYKYVGVDDAEDKYDHALKVATWFD